jgi:2-hydroxychromene-2-carboxylate isomerase
VKNFDFYFDFGSPAAYLAYTQLPTICEATGAQVQLQPMLLGGVFQATGNASPAALPAMGRFVFVDLKRFANTFGVALCHNPNFPIITTTLMRMATALQMHNDPQFNAFLQTIFQAIWVDAKNMNDPAVVGQVLSAAGFDATALLAQANDQASKDQLKAVTMKAVERGVFGAPTFFVGNEMFWGQDRIEQVKQALKA